jgi:hypothetical protein
MAQPTRTVSHTARNPEEKLQLTQQAHAQKRSVSLPRITAREGSVPSPLLERDRSSESSLVESSSEDHGVDPVGNADEAPAYTGAVQVPAPAPAIDPARKAATLEIMERDVARIHLIMRQLPAHFSVPDPARKHLLEFGDTLVSFENASAGELAHLLHCVISNCKKDNEALTYACVEHLLSLGVDVNLSEYRNDDCVCEWIRPLDMAVSRQSVQVLGLLLQHGARPDGTFELVNANGDMNMDIARELLKAGADPWLSIGLPGQLPKSGTHVSIADFYQQTGMDINAEASGADYSASTLSTLELAYGNNRAEVVEQLLEAGVYIGDAIRLKFGWNEEQHLAYYGPATADAIAAYRAQRAYVPYGFAPYALLHDTLQPGAAVTVDTSTKATTAATTTCVSASVSTLAQAALKPACNTLIDGLYTVPQVAKLLGCLNNMPPTSAQAVAQALALARVLGHYRAGVGGRATQLDQGIRVALAGAVLWERYLDCKVQFETLQTHIDRHQADGRTLLTMAASNGKIRMIRILVKLGARVNYPDAHGDYPLTAAAKARKPDTCSALLSLGANAGTSDLQKRSTLFHLADWLTQTDISDTATIDRIATLMENLLRLGYDFRQPTPEDHADHAAHPTVVELLCTPENCVKLAMLGPQRTEILTQAILFNIDRRGSLPFLN